MLQAIELSGFKSFADRTRFEFPTGITVIVGPNGSGKSNVVDAIKWVLGEQSPKSLRGKEMADVIFNGSGGRRALNAAEVTLTLDNRQRLLSVDSDQVQITRRVYRGGEGEYLINRQTSRLRDLRELFAGTGVATEAYSVIEQGKVDVLLQASPRERRLIFEEAAGISRFKAKKLEAARRLERVEQNLLRLSDIVDEVESRLRSVRMQASKARRFREHTARLKELRTSLAATDWNRLSQQLREVEAEMDRLNNDGQQCRAESERVEADTLSVETEILRFDESIRTAEARFAERREQIAAAESSIEAQRARAHDLEEASARHRRQQGALAAGAGDLAERSVQTQQEAREAEQRAQRLKSELAAAEGDAAAVSGQIAALRQEADTLHKRQAEHRRQLSAIVEELAASQSRRAAAEHAAARAEQRIAQLTQSIEDVDAQLLAMGAEHSNAESESARLSAHQESLQIQVATLRRQLAGDQANLGESRSRRSAWTERAAVLAELEQKLEGLGAGVKQALDDARAGGDTPFRKLRGLVADLIEVDVEMAPLVDVALGESAARLVLESEAPLLQSLLEGGYPLKGRIVVARRLGWAPTAGGPNFQKEPGVVGRATEFVVVAPEHRWLVERLLADAWIVEDLRTAVTLAERAAGAARFVTRAGELVEADGSLHVGPRLSATGLLSRRAELRVLGDRIAGAEKEIVEIEAAIAVALQAIAAGDASASQNAVALRAAQHQQSEVHSRRRAAEERRTQWAEQLATLQTERQSAVADAERAGASGQTHTGQRRDIEAQIAAIAESIAQTDARRETLEVRRAEQAATATGLSIELARAQQQLDYLHGRLRQIELHRAERRQALAEAEDQLAAQAAKVIDAQRKILGAESGLALAYLDKEADLAEVRHRLEGRDRLRAARSELASRSQKLRARLRVINDTAHERELAAGEIRHQRGVLSDRLREDYGVELSAFAEQPSPPASESPIPEDRDAAEQEIADLRRKIASIGGVNLEALAELEELETRHASLAGQQKDLVSAKNALAAIIERINADSRRLFVETLELVRGHFQELFRKLFGGGQADIVLEEAADILDAGVEIVARPPGKEPRNISLLSGGEKTLACVALLLAVFRSRPSPFCVLDEVDAALDEANIERFVGVLREYLTITKFIVVTHSKKTMTAASTLYGVTMQESGVSKRVSVRFEDVSANGEISQAAIARTIEESPAETESLEVLGEPLQGESPSEAEAASGEDDQTQAA